jgi:hypothetical protein
MTLHATTVYDEPGRRPSWRWYLRRVDGGLVLAVGPWRVYTAAS